MSDGIQLGMTGTNQVESGEVKVDRDGEGSLTKKGEEREMESDEVKVKQDGVVTRRAER